MIIGRVYKIRRKIRIYKNKTKWIIQYKFIESDEFKKYREMRKLFSTP